MINLFTWISALKEPDDINIKKFKVNHIPVLVLSSPDKHSEYGCLWIHGGGYIMGMKEMVYMSRAMDLVRNFGMTVFALDYHLAIQSPYPAALNDCYDILLYMDAYKEKYGFSKIVVGGESAGGGLAVAVCMLARDTKKVDISYQLPLYPMLDCFDTESSKDNHGKIWNTKRNHLAWKLYLRDKNAINAYSSPSRQTNYADLPPAYTFVGSGEPFYYETLEYIENLRKAGIQAGCDVYPTDIHAFDMLYPELEFSKQAIHTFNERIKALE